MLVHRWMHLIIVAVLCAGSAIGEELAPLRPVFSASGFRFDDVKSVCVAPVLDFRQERTLPLMLHGHVEKSKPGFFSGLLGLQTGIAPVTADENIERILKANGFDVVTSSQIDVTLAALKKGVSSWPCEQSRWMLVTALEMVIEDPKLKAHSSPKVSWGNMENRYRAVVSAYLFEKQGSDVQLVWRDELPGSAWEPMAGGMIEGPTEQIRALFSLEAINDGLTRLLDVHYKRRFGLWNKQDPSTAPTHTFRQGCDKVWGALKLVARSQETVQVDENDMTVLFNGEMSGHRMTMGRGQGLIRALAWPTGSGCSVQITETLSPGSYHDKDASGVVKALDAKLAK